MLFRAGVGPRALWWWLGVVAGAVALVLLWADPAGAQSPCDSEAVLPAGKEGWRPDCEALWEFYSGLEDAGVLDDAGNEGAWGAGTPFADWRGVGVDTEGVVWIDLPKAGLSGPLSPALGRLSHLEHLNLRTNSLSGDLPAALGRLSRLTLLELGGNRFSGRLPVELGNLADLKYLVIHSSSISGSIPTSLGNLKQLEHLYLFGNDLSGGIPVELGGLSELRVLALSSNRLEGPIPAELGNLEKLEELYLHSNELSGRIPSSLADLKNLKKLHLGGNKLSGRIPTRLALQLANAESETDGQPAENEIEDIYSADPLGLIAHADVYRQHSLGTQTWTVWVCDVPLGDASIDQSTVERRLNREVAPYFEWVSGGRYRPAFRVAGMVASDDAGFATTSGRSGCESAVAEQAPAPPVLIVDDSAANDGYARGNELVVVGGGTVVTAPGFSRPRLSTVVHEIGHGLGFPHSFGGRITWSAEGQFTGVYEYDNPMDVMSGGLALDLRTGTIAVNRYAAGWIIPEEVAVHDPGTTEVYELRPPGDGGTQMLVLPGRRQGVFTALGARVAVGYDSSIPRQGVEVYRVDQRVAACAYPSRGACWGTNVRVQPYPPTDPGAGHADTLTRRDIARMVDHVHGVGDTLKVGAATVEVVERVGNNYMVRVVDESVVAPAESAPTFSGRFSDDDGSVHEENIEAIAELGITRGCGNPEDNTFCPKRLVARSHMIAFLARALGVDDGAAVATSRFSDVPDGIWYLPSLERLADLGVVEPFEDGTFRPGDPVTRLDMAVFMARAFPHIDKVEDPVGVFADVPAGSVHAGEVEGIYAVGVTTGCLKDPLRYCPDKPVRRDQMASFLVRAFRPAGTGS